jgi:hypothetical protein
MDVPPWKAPRKALEMSGGVMTEIRLLSQFTGELSKERVSLSALSRVDASRQRGTSASKLVEE